MLDFIIAIPARYASTRLPQKMMLPLGGMPVIERTWRLGLAAGAKEVVVATDDLSIAQHMQGVGAQVVMTAIDHESGTDRLAELAQIRGWHDTDIIVNLQGDEPLLPVTLLQQVAAALAAHPNAAIATLCTPIDTLAAVFDPNQVKVVFEAGGAARYFSRAPIPWHRDLFTSAQVVGDMGLPIGYKAYRHLGIYAYRAAFLKHYPQLAMAAVEQIEKLEQLRALMAGFTIHVEVADTIPPVGIDTQEDLDRAHLCL